MKKFLLLLLFLFLIPHVASGAWLGEDGKPMAETESMQSIGKFGVQLVLTPDEDQFRRKWTATRSAPKLTPVGTARPGSSLTAVFIFTGCSTNDNGRCDVVAEFILEGPDGKITPVGGSPVWVSVPLPDGVLQLGDASLQMSFNDNDPLGNYKVLAIVRDRVAGHTLNLVTEFKLTK